MLGKLMKYELIAMGRVFLPMFGALIIISIVNAILGQFGELTTPRAIAIFVSVLLIIGIVVIVYVVTLQRFWTNLMSNEGYLMMTLPVSIDKIILSKLFVATIWSIVSYIVVIASILIMSSAEVNWLTTELWIYAQIPFTGHEITLIIIASVVMLIVSSFANILILYACMALGMMTNKYRILVAVAAYIAIMTIMQIVIAVAIGLTAALGGFEAFERWANSLSTFGGMHAMIWSITGLSAILCAIFYTITRFMMSRRLNLQ